MGNSIRMASIIFKPLTNASIIASARPPLPASRLNTIARRTYASGPTAAKSHTPWIFAGLALTGVGTYVMLAPQGSKGHEVKEHAKEKAHDAKEKAKSKAEEAAERERKRDEERAPKPNPNADSAKRHEGHAEINEKKVRKGKFSDVEFDNHDTSHSTDPGADFEVKKSASK